jgi:hypothetical protein
MSITHTLPLNKAADDSIGPDHGCVKDSLDEVRTTDALTVVVTETRSQLIEARSVAG